MTEIPEHLRKRAEAARQKAEAAKADAPAADAPAADAPAAAADAPASASDSKIPAHLLERSKAAKARKAAGTAEAEGGGGVGTLAPAGAAAVATAAPPPAATGPAGHTQRLLTVVKSGSIQDVKSTPVDKVHTWPHLLVVEFVASLLLTAFVLVFSIFVNAPLLSLANFNLTPN